MRDLHESFSWLLTRDFISECFATHKCEPAKGKYHACPWFFIWKGHILWPKTIFASSKSIPITLIIYLCSRLIYSPTKSQTNIMPYIGIVLQINDLFYFAPLSSSKPKHRHMQEGLDFIKVKQYSVINLNNMLPVPLSDCIPIDFSKERDPKYRNLLMAEYRFIKMIEEKVQKNARLLYNHKIRYGNSTPLAKRCNDFLLLEQKCREYEQSNLPTNPSLSGTPHSPKSTLE